MPGLAVASWARLYIGRYYKKYGILLGCLIGIQLEFKMEV